MYCSIAIDRCEEHFVEVVQTNYNKTAFYILTYTSSPCSLAWPQRSPTFWVWETPLPRRHSSVKVVGQSSWPNVAKVAFLVQHMSMLSLAVFHVQYLHTAAKSECRRSHFCEELMYKYEIFHTTCQCKQNQKKPALTAVQRPTIAMFLW